MRNARWSWKSERPRGAPRRGAWSDGLRSMAVVALLLLLSAPVSGRAADEGAAADAAAPSGGGWYAQVLGRGARGMVVTHLWSSGPRFRAELVAAGHRIVTIVNGEYYYTLDEASASGIAIRRAPEAVRFDRERGRHFGRELEELLAAGGEPVGTEELGGRTCRLYRVTDEEGRRTVCADPETGLPIRVETFRRASGSTDGVDYLNWLSGMSLPDSFFEPDPRFELERMELDDYRTRIRQGPVGPAPVLYSQFLYGARPR